MSAGITRTSRTVLDSQGAFVAGNSRRTVRRTPTIRFEARSSRLGALGPRAPRRSSRVMVVHSDHVRIACFARSWPTATPAAFVSRTASSPSAFCYASKDRTGPRAGPPLNRAAGRFCSPVEPLRWKLAFGPAYGAGQRSVDSWSNPHAGRGPSGLPTAPGQRLAPRGSKPIPNVGSRVFQRWGATACTSQVETSCRKLAFGSTNGGGDGLRFAGRDLSC
jgi:hypothetical protein